MFLSCRGAGIGGLGITVEGPSESKISCKDNKDGSCSAEYIPYVPGDYDVNITYGGEHIPGKSSCSMAFRRGMKSNYGLRVLSWLHLPCAVGCYVISAFCFSSEFRQKRQWHLLRWVQLSGTGKGALTLDK